MSPSEFEPTIPASERPQTYTLDRAATGTDKLYNILQYSSTLIFALQFQVIFLIILTLKAVKLKASVW